MNYILSPTSFFVNELHNPTLGTAGQYFYYLIEKKGLSHKQLVKRLGAKGFFSGVKDRNATTKQWFCSNYPIDERKEKDLTVTFKGMGKERLFVGAHKANAFEVDVFLDEGEWDNLTKFKPKNELVCNYFGEQRFDKRVNDFATSLNEKNYEKALKIFLTEKSDYDSERSSAIKKTTINNWGDWKTIKESEHVKGTKKEELFDFLAAHSKDSDCFEKAFFYVERKSLKEFIKACQSIRFNAALNDLAEKKRPNNFFAEINKAKLRMSASKAFPRSLSIEGTEFEKSLGVRRVERKTFFGASKFKAKKISGNKVTLVFELARGSYATVFLEFLKSYLASKK
ncbi:MAG: tRNA pseudouridine(13) synthase TruD [archaeon]